MTKPRTSKPRDSKARDSKAGNHQARDGRDGRDGRNGKARHGRARDIRYHRVYEDASPEDGVRVLVDRIWPRGLRKDDAHLDAWLRDVAPSTELRRWYGHDPERYPEFRRRYLTELRDPDHQHALRELRDLARHERVTLLTASRDVDHSQAAVLADRLSHDGRTKA